MRAEGNLVYTAKSPVDHALRGKLVRQLQKGRRIQRALSPLSSVGLAAMDPIVIGDPELAFNEWLSKTLTLLEAHSERYAKAFREASPSAMRMITHGQLHGRDAMECQIKCDALEAIIHDLTRQQVSG